MKKIGMIILLAAGICSAQELVFTNQTIKVLPDQLSVKSVEYHAQEIVTNMVPSWIPVDVVYTNGMFDGGEIVTNTVQQQIFTETVSTNAARWTCNVIFSLPTGHKWSLNGFPVTVERFKAKLEISIDTDTVQSTFGASSAGLEFAASNGAYQPSGTVKDAFLGFAAAVLQAGIDNGGASE